MMRFFSWIRSLFSGSAPAAESDPDRFDLFLPSERMIYSYFDGKEVVHRDPIVLHRKVTEVGQELAVDIKASDNKLSNKIAAEGHKGTIEKVKKIFGVTAYEESKGEGLTEAELLALLDHFLTYCQLVKKNSNPLSTSSTATSPSTVPSPAGPSPTTSSSDSGSTDSGGTISAPTSSPSASA